MCAQRRKDGLWRGGGSHPYLQMSQYRTGQYQSRHRRNVSSDRPETRAALPGRVRIPLQSTIRSRGNDAAANLGWRADHAHALPTAQVGRRLYMINSAWHPKNWLRKVRKQVCIWCNLADCDQAASQWHVENQSLRQHASRCPSIETQGPLRAIPTLPHAYCEAALKVRKVDTKARYLL